MIISVRLNNYYVFSNEVEFSAKADMRTKKYRFVVFEENGFNIVKSSCLFGANNSGKSCLVRAIQCIRDVLLGNSSSRDFVPNHYTSSNVCELGISFYYEGKAYSYDFNFDCSKGRSKSRGFVYECFSELNIDKHGNSRERELFFRDTAEGEYWLQGEDAGNVFMDAPRDRILIYAPGMTGIPAMKHCSDILQGFASLIDVVNMEDISLDKTVDIFKNDRPMKSRVMDVIRGLDLYIDDIVFRGGAVSSDGVVPEDSWNLYSTYKGVEYQTLKYDSNGTRKLLALASYIADAIDNGKILVIDEMSGSVHYRLIRCLISFFDNEGNYDAQLIFTSFDFTLLDRNDMFRKDQVNFINRDENGEFIYSLNFFNSADDKVRSESDWMQRYRNGFFHAVPEPDPTGFIVNTKDRRELYEQSMCGNEKKEKEEWGEAAAG